MRVCPSVNLYQSIYLSIYDSLFVIYLSNYLSICQPACLYQPVIHFLPNILYFFLCRNPYKYKYE